MKSKKAVAYLIESDYDEGGLIVFAKSREQARNIALLLSGQFDHSRYIDLRAYRKPQMDKYYKRGKEIMDFNDPKDRLALVKDAGFYCSEYNRESDCAKCNAKKYCYVWNSEEGEG